MPKIFDTLDKVKPVYDVLDKVLLFICKLFLITDILITSFAVAGRYISFIPDPSWSEEVVLTCMSYMAVLSAALAIRRKAHIRMTAFDRYLPANLLKVLDLIADISVLVLGGVMLIIGWKYASTIGGRGTYVSMPNVSRFWMYAPIPVAGLFMVLISRLLTYARRNRFYTIVPGTLTIGEQTASLAAVVVTRGCVLGVNCYGFGGSIEGKSGSADWVQTLNGERKSFPSPTVKNEEQRKILADVLVDAGYPEVDAQVVGVFTEPKVRFTKVAGKGCYTMDMFRDFLASDMCMRSKDLDPSEIGKKLEAYVKRAKS